MMTWCRGWGHISARLRPSLCKGVAFIEDSMPGESISDYLTHLRKLSEHCQFADLNDRLRDQFVAGISDDNLQRRLLEEQDNLSFDTALKIAVTFETAKRDASKLRMESSLPDMPIQKVF